MKALTVLILIVLVSTPLRAADQGLVAHWQFDEGTGDVLHDGSGNGNDGKLLPFGGKVHAGPEWVKARKGFALRFDGRNDHVLCGNKSSLRISRALAITVWLNTDGTESNQYVVSKYAYNLRLHRNDEDPKMWDVCLETRNEKDDAWGELRAYKAVPSRKWTFVAVVYDADREDRRIYVNGKLARQEPSGGPLGGVAKAPLVLGRYIDQNSGYYKGLLDEVRVYARALGAGEIKKRYRVEKRDVDTRLRDKVRARPRVPLVPATREKYIGLKQRVPSRPILPVPGRVGLQHERTRVDISPVTGSVSRIVYLPKRTVLVNRSEDVYLLEGRRILEGNDQVTGYRKEIKGEANGLDLVCTNRSLPGIEIVKQYRLQGNRLVKTVYFRGTSEESKGKLLLVRSHLRMGNDFYRHGYFYRPIWSSGGAVGMGAVPFVPESKITKPAKLKDGHNCLFIYLQPALNLGLAHYKFKVNGFYEGSRSEAMQSDIIKYAATFEPGGWELYLTGDIVRPGAFLSIESHFMVFHGDAREFHRQHLALPEYAGLIKSKHKLPDWFRKVKCIGHHQYLPFVKGHDVAERVAAVCSQLGPDEYYAYLFADWSTTGDYPSEGTVIAVDGWAWKCKTTAQEVRKNLRKFRAVAPNNLKLALYTWQASASDKSKAYMQDHPHWLLRERDGALVPFGSSEVHNYGKNVTTQEHMDFIIEQYRKMMDFYELDYTYIDGGAGGEFVSYLPEKVFTHGYHGVLLGNAIKTAAEEKGGVHLQNVSVHPETSHCGYAETRSDAPIHDRRDWRILANLFWLSKYYQPEGWTSVLNWSYQGYSNRSIMYGFPVEFSTPWHLFDLSHMFLTADLCFEVKDSHIVDGDHITPNWWRFETDTLESAFLKQGAAYLLPLVSHTQADKKERVAVSLRGLDLDPGKPIYVWSFQPLIDFGLDYTAPIEEARDTIARDLQVVSAQGDTLHIETMLKAKRLKMLAITQVPAFVYSVHGRENNFLLPASRGVAITGGYRGNTIRLNVAAETPAEILVLLPKDWPNAEANVAGAATPCHRFTLPRHVLARLPVPSGKSLVKLRQKPTPLAVPRYESPAKLRQGQATAAPLVPMLRSPQRNSLSDYALGFYVENGKPKIKTVRKEGKSFHGVPCWEITGPGTLINYFGVSLKGTGGVTFKLNRGTARGEFVFVNGYTSGNAFFKKIPLDFTGWKEFSFTKHEFDKIPKDLKWEKSPRFSLVIPAGTLWLSDFRFLPRAKDEPQDVARKPKVIIPQTKTPPQLDGSLSDECWRKAAKLQFGVGDIKANKTTVYLTYDKDHLYVAARCEESVEKAPRKALRDADIVCKPPNFEMHLIPKGSKKAYQLCTNPAASQWDAVYSPMDIPVDDRDWNGKWQVKASIGWGAAWFVELAIPFADLGVESPNAGQTWSAGFFRQAPLGLSGWIYGGGSFYQPKKHFGELVFSDK